MDDSVNELVCFLVWPHPETAMGLLCNFPVSASPYTLRDAIIPRLRSKGAPPRTNDLESISRSPAVINRQNKTETDGTLVVYLT